MTTSEPAPAGPGLQPVTEHQRLAPVDTLRGFALLGILAMNIIAFALPGIVYLNPAAEAARPFAGPLTGLNRAAWLTTHFLFDTKMMTIFSMLFGAGLVLMADRAERGSVAPARLRGVYYRRLAWLLIFGVIHAYALWFGDILTSYALCGMLLYPMRRLRPVTLIIVGGAFMVIAPIISTAQGFGLYWVRDQAHAAQAILDAGGSPTGQQKEMLELWDSIRPNLDPTPEQVAAGVEKWRSFPQVFFENARAASFMQVQLFLTFTLWRVTGLMLIGMALMKLGVFSAARSIRFYTVMAVAGYATGLPLIALGVLDISSHHHDVLRFFFLASHFNYAGSVAVALAHTALIMLACRSGLLPGLRARLAAVGRTAFSNYLLQSLICTALFFGWGFAMFGRLERWQLAPFVVGVWIVQLVISPLWLARYRSGPLEWLWRSLTYWRV